MKKSLLLISFSLSCFAMAQVPKYYQSINLKQGGNSLKKELAALTTKNHKRTLTYKKIWETLKITDVDPKNPQHVVLIYGYDNSSAKPDEHRTRDHSKKGGEKGQWNREHVYPKSLGNPNLGTVGAGADAHLLRPADVSRNSKRSNLPFIDGTGKASKRDNKGWYPGNEWRGDIARIVMYMYIRYGERTLPNTVAKSTNTYSKEMPDLFLKWNAEDPVSAIERTRNNYLGNIYNTYGQGNRNPFIDNPYLATKIWGGPKAKNTWKELK